MLAHLWRRKFKRDIVIVSGLPRSGTSLMMQMLAAGGMTLLTDGKRDADENNPRGYYEYEPVKRLAYGDHAWLKHAQNKAVKVVSPLLHHLPPIWTYRVVFMRRSIEEIIASQHSMTRILTQDHKPANQEDNSVSQVETYDEYEHHLLNSQRWLQRQTHINFVNIHYGHLLTDPLHGCQSIAHFLSDQQLDIQAMQTVIEPTLHRHRKT